MQQGSGTLHAAKSASPCQKKWSSIILLPLHRTTAPPTVCESVLHGDVPSHPSHLNQSQGFGRLTGGAKGVLSGVSLDIEAVGFRDNMTGVVDARHLNRMMKWFSQLM